LLAWVGALAPVELFYAIDIVPFMPEMHAGIIASQFNPAGYFDASGGFGLPVELCSAHRVMMGMYLSNELPTPDLLVNTSQVCDSGIKFF
jgi:benzoyl-CoA reductase/2-hydroxyglutaryl-CoA dehydratase subunit BcrC/BadD/HgdB